jgi:hypothetical protein
MEKEKLVYACYQLEQTSTKIIHLRNQMQKVLEEGVDYHYPQDAINEIMTKIDLADKLLLHAEGNGI